MHISLSPCWTCTARRLLRATIIARVYHGMKTESGWQMDSADGWLTGGNCRRLGEVRSEKDMFRQHEKLQGSAML